MLESDNIVATGELLRKSNHRVDPADERRPVVRLPPALGGTAIFEPKFASAMRFN